MNIILAMNDEIFSSKITKYLTWYGYTVFNAYNLENAWEIINKEKIDLLICHEFLKENSAYLLMKEIRNSDNDYIKNINILLIGHLLPSKNLYKIMEDLKISFLNQYSELELWDKKIKHFVKLESGVLDEKK